MMSRQQRFIQLPLVGALLLCLLAIAYLVVRKRSSQPDPSDKVAKHRVDTPADDALKYWTADRKRHAKPANLPNVNNLERKKQHPRRPPRTSDPRHA